MAEYTEARAIDPYLFDQYGETGRYHLRRPTTIQPTPEEIETAEDRLGKAEAKLERLKEKSSENRYDTYKYNKYQKMISEQESKIRTIENQYAWYRYEQELKAFKKHVDYHRRGGMKRRRKTRRK